MARNTTGVKYMLARHQITSDDDLSLWTDDTALPHFHITQDTLEKIYNFQRSYPDIPMELFDKEINRTLADMVSRMEQEATYQQTPCSS
jgi:hypothetical protein